MTRSQIFANLATIWTGAFRRIRQAGERLAKRRAGSQPENPRNIGRGQAAIGRQRYQGYKRLDRNLLRQVRGSAVEGCSSRGGLIKILWHDCLGMSLYAKGLKKGRFIWPSPADGVVAISASQLPYMLDGIDWRNPRHTFRPERAG